MALASSSGVLFLSRSGRYLMSNPDHITRQEEKSIFAKVFVLLAPIKTFVVVDKVREPPAQQ